MYGKIKAIAKTGGASSQINYGYDPGGNRTVKTVEANETVNKTFYVRDAQGNVMGLYTQKNSEPIRWNEQHLYGSSRLGMWQWDTLVPTAAPIVQSGGEPIFFRDGSPAFVSLKFRDVSAGTRRCRLFRAWTADGSPH